MNNIKRINFYLFAGNRLRPAYKTFALIPQIRLIADMQFFDRCEYGLGLDWLAWGVVLLISVKAKQ